MHRKRNRGTDGERADDRLLGLPSQHEHSHHDGRGTGSAGGQTERRGEQEVDDPKRHRKREAETSIQKRSP